MMVTFAVFIITGLVVEETQVDVSPLEGTVRIFRTETQEGLLSRFPVTRDDAATKPPERRTWIEAVDGERRQCIENDGDGFYTTCTPIADPKPTPDRDLAAEVQRAVRTIGVPGLPVHVQPGPEVLVNMDTILYTDARLFTKTVTLLGDDILIEATPTRFRWHHGDDTSQTTRKPGRPYPAKDITHVYDTLATGLELRVDTTYAIRYRTPDGHWHDLADTLTIAGPTTTLSTYEARPILVSPRR